jgi:hypothetical protein
MIHLCPDQKAREVPPALTALTFAFLLVTTGGQRRPKTIKQTAAWCAVPETAPVAATRIISKQQVWHPINFNPKSDSWSKHPFVRQKTATPYCLKCFPNAQIRASQDSSQISWE